MSTFTFLCSNNIQRRTESVSLGLFSRCEEFLRSREHIDLDLPPTPLWEHQWEQFLTEYYSLTQGGAKIQVREVGEVGEVGLGRRRGTGRPGQTLLSTDAAKIWKKEFREWSI